MLLTRRDLCSLLPTPFFPLLLGASAPTAQDLPSAVYPFEELARNSSGGAEIRSVLKGRLATGEALEVHETTLPPGGAPHPPHHHTHSEMWLIRAGTVEITVNGRSHQLEAGSVGFVRSNEEHGIRNVGTTPSIYFVVAIGPGADR